MDDYFEHIQSNCPDSVELAWETNESTRLLFTAIEKDDMELLDLALQKPDTNINMQTLHSETALLRSLVANRSDDFIMHLVRAGCDVTISTKDKLTPLHLALLRPSVDIAHELIKRGADINTPEQTWWMDFLLEKGPCKENTPLNCAINSNNLEAVCMLLYYGADVYVYGRYMMSPLEFAICGNNIDSVEILINFYDELYFEDKSESFCVNYNSKCKGLKLLDRSTHSYYPKSMPMLLWPRINHLFDNVGLNEFLIDFVNARGVSSKDGLLEDLRLILEFFVANDYYIFSDRFLKYVIDDFYEIKPQDRLSIINIGLSLSAPVTVYAIKSAHELYGFADELEALIYGKKYLGLPINLCTITTFVLPIIAADPNKELFYDVVKQIRDRRVNRVRHPLNHFLNLLGLYSLPVEVKQEIKEFCQVYLHLERQQIFKKLDRIPELPSLFELCRNKIRKTIKQSSYVKYPYQFHDCVKKLNIPLTIQDVIRLKAPIYL